MTRILTIIALLFATPAWATDDRKIIIEGEILFGDYVKFQDFEGFKMLVKYDKKLFQCNFLFEEIETWCEVVNNRGERLEYESKYLEQLSRQK